MRTSPTLRILLPLLLVGLIGLAAVLSRRSGKPQGGSQALEQGAAVTRYGFALREVSKESGVDFVHQAPTFDARLGHIMPQMNAMGAAVAVADFDNDGWSDFFVANSKEGSACALYRNLGDGKFADVAAAMGLADLNQAGSGIVSGALWGDYDNDGDDDLFVNKWGRPELFRNEAGKAFTPVTEGSGLPAWLNASSAVWLDFDQDGLLDLFLGGYYDEQIDLWKLADTKMMPESFEYAQNGGRKYLLRNLGEGRFEDVAEAVGLVSRRWALAAAAADLRGTGYPDLVIANDYGVSEYFRNDGGKFTEIGAKTGIGDRPKSGMNVAMGDVFNQGRLAIYISNISEEGILVQGNNLWVPREGSSGDDTVYDNLAQAMNVEMGGWSFGSQFGDLNNDGFQDLFLTNGFVSADRQENYWYDYSQIAGGNKVIISDAANWPAMGDRSLGGYQTKRVWVNDGAGRFQDVAQAVGVTETFDGRAVAMADLWNRGVLDVIVASQKGPLLIYRNEADAAAKGWIAFELEGSVGNRGAIGAQVRLERESGVTLQELQSASGFCAQNQRRLHFGLGAATAAKRAVITWPGGREQVLESPAINQIHRLKEPGAVGSLR
jgi:hypothetical protein